MSLDWYCLFAELDMYYCPYLDKHCDIIGGDNKQIQDI